MVATQSSDYVICVAFADDRREWIFLLDFAIALYVELTNAERRSKNSYLLTHTSVREGSPCLSYHSIRATLDFVG
jgi:hypothetical protein